MEQVGYEAPLSRPQRVDNLKAAFVAFPAVVASIVLGLIGCRRSFGSDAGITVALFVRGPFSATVRQQYYLNNHPYFSMVEHVMGKFFGTSEATMRVLPIAFGAGLAAVVGATMARRFGALAGALASAVTITNPIMMAAVRDVRGYSMAYLLVGIATVILVKLLEPAPQRWMAWAYIVTLGLAIGTHLTVLGAAGAGAVAVIVQRGLSWTWAMRWIDALLIGALPYLAESRAYFGGNGNHQSLTAFPGQAVLQLGGGRVLSLALLCPAVFLGLAAAKQNRAAVAALVVVGVYFAVLWLGPTEGGVRFCGWLVPVIAALAAIGCGCQPRPWVRLVISVGVLASCALALASQIPDLQRDPTPARVEARLAAADVAAGRSVCALGSNVDNLLAYGSYRASFDADTLARCDVVLVVDPSADPELVAAVAPRFRTIQRIDAVRPGFILRDPLPVTLR